MKDLILLKIGGSICTEKSKGEFRVKEKTVERIAQEIVEARKEKDFTLLVVNGAGPFGHVNVKDYDINDGLRSESDFEGFSKTISDCLYLNWSVSEAMRKAGMHTLPFPSSSVIVQSDKRIITFCLDVVKRIWAANPAVVPVMNGTMVPDLELKGSVVSGDAVIEHLAGRLKPKLIIFATDVDGIFTADPGKDKKARLIETITKESFDDVRKGIGGSSSTDVTGGMIGKVRRLLGLDTRCLIINGSVPGRVRKALLGGPVKGTLVAGE
jgi:isopentenyl phosphate kinase